VAEFVKIGTVEQFREGRGRPIQIAGTVVAVFRTRTGFVAFADSCPHMGASLADGRLLGKFVECAWHSWRFDLETGCSDMRSWATIPIYEVKVEGNDVMLRLPDPPPVAEEPVVEEPWEPFDPDKHLKRTT
jgi:nitrite reductase (NADH) small subunit